MRRVLVFILCCLPWAAVEAAENVAVVTIADGTATVIRGATRYRLAEGVRLDDEDLLDTGDKSFVQIEYGDGLRLELGPGVRLQLAPRLAREKQPRPSRLYVMSGWLKLSAPAAQAPAAGKAAAPATPAPAVTYAGALVDLAGQGGTTVTHIGTDQYQLFVESGDARLTDRRTPGTTVALRAGEFFSRKGADRTSVTQRPPPEFLAGLPVPFRDSLPSRAARFKDRPTAPKEIGPIAYEDVAVWLQAEPAVRRQFLPRWRGLAQNKAFRAGLVADLKVHPEWDRVLFPEKYLPKKPVVASPAPPRAPTPVAHEPAAGHPADAAAK